MSKKAKRKRRSGKYSLDKLISKSGTTDKNHEYYKNENGQVQRRKVDTK
jgi:hypothetical protein